MNSIIIATGRFLNLTSAIAIVRLCVLERDEITLRAVLLEVSKLLVQSTILSFIWYYVGCLGLLAWSVCTLLFQVLAIISALEGEWRQVNDLMRLDIKRACQWLQPEAGNEGAKRPEMREVHRNGRLISWRPQGQGNEDNRTSRSPSEAI